MPLSGDPSKPMYVKSLLQKITSLKPVLEEQKKGIGEYGPIKKRHKAQIEARKNDKKKDLVHATCCACPVCKPPVPPSKRNSPVKSKAGTYKGRKNRFRVKRSHQIKTTIGGQTVVKTIDSITEDDIETFAMEYPRLKKMQRISKYTNNQGTRTGKTPSRPSFAGSSFALKNIQDDKDTRITNLLENFDKANLEEEEGQEELLNYLGVLGAYEQRRREKKLQVTQAIYNNYATSFNMKIDVNADGKFSLKVNQNGETDSKGAGISKLKGRKRKKRPLQSKKRPVAAKVKPAETEPKSSENTATPLANKFDESKIESSRPREKVGESSGGRNSVCKQDKTAVNNTGVSEEETGGPDLSHSKPTEDVLEPLKGHDRNAHPYLKQEKAAETDQTIDKPDSASAVQALILSRGGEKETIVIVKDEISSVSVQDLNGELEKTISPNEMPKKQLDHETASNADKQMKGLIEEKPESQMLENRVEETEKQGKDPIEENLSEAPDENTEGIELEKTIAPNEMLKKQLKQDAAPNVDNTNADKQMKGPIEEKSESQMIEDRVVAPDAPAESGFEQAKKSLILNEI